MVVFPFVSCDHCFDIMRSSFNMLSNCTTRCSAFVIAPADFEKMSKLRCWKL
jgi:hypothetical protein